MKKGEIISLQSDTKCIVSKWKDKRDVLFLTTKDVPEMVEVPHNRGPVQKPSTILEYNKAKAYIDLSDQLASYATSLRKGVKWYRKVAIELITNTTVVNAFEIYKILNGPNKHFGITEFREKLALSLLFGDNLQGIPRTSNSRKHELRDTEDKKRKRCSTCYTTITERFGAATARKQAKQVITHCVGCPDIQNMCVSCFFLTHDCSKK